MTSEDPPPMPSTPPPMPSTPPPTGELPPAPVDGIPGALILPADLPTWAPAPPSASEPASEPVSEPASDAATEASISPPSEFAPPTGFAPPSYLPPVPSFPAPSSSPPVPGGHRVRAGGPAKGRGKLVGLIVGAVVVIALLVGGGFALFHSSSKKTTTAAPGTPAPVGSPAGPAAGVSPGAAPASDQPSAAGTAASTAPASVAPTAPASPTADANLGGMQAKQLQTTVIAPLKNLISLDLHVANADDNCVSLAPNAAGYAARAAQRQKLLTTLRKLDVTAMQDYKTWKGLLEQVELKNIKFEQQLAAYSKALEAGCNPATATQNAHYKNALTLAHDSGQLQKMFLASFNPAARKYNIPMQSQGNL